VRPLPVSVIVLTLNEEADLGGCLDSLAGWDDVHILDSGSTDRTAEIAQARRVPVTVNPFRGFGQQRNWAIDNIATKYVWQLHLDADERMTPELTMEIGTTLKTDPLVGGYFVPSRLMFAGRWLRHAGQYPAYQVRLFHRDRLRFADHGHGQREVTTSPLGRLTQPYLHFGFSKGLDRWFAKHAVYARLEAEQAYRRDDLPGGRFLSRDLTGRRRAIKRLAMRLPGRYFLRLAYMLVVRRAVLDGWAGITYSHMLAVYEAMIEVHLRLVRRNAVP
jgi:glycosyltransferase involved in cell wall biosynthesis